MRYRVRYLFDAISYAITYAISYAIPLFCSPLSLFRPSPNFTPMGRGLDYSTLIKLWKGHNTMRSAQQLKFLHFIRGRGRKLRQHSIDIALERRSHPAKPPSKSLSEFDAQADPPAVANVQVTTPEGFQEYPQGSHNGTRRLAHRLLAGDPRRRRSSSFSGAAAH